VLCSLGGGTIFSRCSSCDVFEFCTCLLLLLALPEEGDLCFTCFLSVSEISLMKWIFLKVFRKMRRDPSKRSRIPISMKCLVVSMETG